VFSPRSSNRDPTGDAAPIANVPLLELTNNPASGRYETDVHGLSIAGDYVINFYAEDIWGGVSLPRTTILLQPGYDERKTASRSIWLTAT